MGRLHAAVAAGMTVFSDATAKRRWSTAGAGAAEFCFSS